MSVSGPQIRIPCLSTPLVEERLFLVEMTGPSLRGQPSFTPGAFLHPTKFRVSGDQGGPV